MSKEPKVAIILLNLNGFSDTVECIESLNRLDYPNYKIVIVDNGSKNDEGEHIKERYSNIHLIKNKRNRGFAGGNNDGINWAIENGFDYIVNLNNDTIVEPDWLSNLIDALIKEKADFGSSLIINYDDRKSIDSAGDILLPDGSGASLYQNKNIFDLFILDKPKIIFSACGAGSIYSRRCLIDVKIKESQYFDELYFSYYEDLDLGIRLNIKNYKGILVPNAKIYHKISRVLGRYSGHKIFLNHRNRILIELLNYPFPLIILGEIYFCLKILFSFVSNLCPNKQRGKGQYLKHQGILRIIIILIKARLWILFHFMAILKDRNERKRRGFINYKIFKNYYWGIP